LYPLYGLGREAFRLNAASILCPLRSLKVKVTVIPSKLPETVTVFYISRSLLNLPFWHPSRKIWLPSIRVITVKSVLVANFPGTIIESRVFLLSSWFSFFLTSA